MPHASPLVAIQCQADTEQQWLMVPRNSEELFELRMDLFDGKTGF